MRSVKPYRTFPAAIAPAAIAEAERGLRGLAECLGHEGAAYINLVLTHAKQAQADAKKNRALMRDERIRWVARNYYDGKSDRRVAAELMSLAGRLRMTEPPRSEPAASVYRIVELNGGAFPSERSIRAALRT